MLCSFLLGTGAGNVILDSYEIPGSRHTAASATKALPNTRSEVSAKLKLSQLSTLWRRHSSLIWTLARMETGKRMLLSQWSLFDTCMCACALCSVLVIDAYWIATWAFTKTLINSPMYAYASAYATLTPLQCLITRGICWFPLCNWLTQAYATLGFAYASSLWYNSFNSHKGRFSKMPRWTPHQLARVFRHWTSTSACMLPAWQNLFNALFSLARNRNRQGDSFWILDSWKPSNSSISN